MILDDWPESRALWRYKLQISEPRQSHITNPAEWEAAKAEAIPDNAMSSNKKASGLSGREA
jgi:hypothetical protein